MSSAQQVIRLAAHPIGMWVQEGRIKYAEEIVDGLEQAPAAFRRLFTGENAGKLIVKVGT